MRTTVRRHRRQLPPEVEAALDELKRALAGVYGDRLQAVYLYGSYARGDFTDDSDIDVLLTLNGKVDPGDETSRYSGIVSHICLRHDVLIATYAIPADWFAKRPDPFFQNLRREAVRA
jgi:predicted nucleotidyltransferase